MLKMRHEEDLPKAFNVPPEELKRFVDLVTQLEKAKNGSAVTSWVVERIWIDETFSDNLKALAIFLLGYSYAQTGRRLTNGRNSTD